MRSGVTPDAGVLHAQLLENPVDMFLYGGGFHPEDHSYLFNRLRFSQPGQHQQFARVEQSHLDDALFQNDARRRTERKWVNRLGYFFDSRRYCWGIEKSLSASLACS
jgi:hypothetical protein